LEFVKTSSNYNTESVTMNAIYSSPEEEINHWKSEAMKFKNRFESAVAPSSRIGT